MHFLKTREYSLTSTFTAQRPPIIQTIHESLQFWPKEWKLSSWSCLSRTTVSNMCPIYIEQKKQKISNAIMDVRNKIGIAKSSSSHEPGMSTGILHPKTGPLSYNIMLPNESAFRKVSHKVYSQFWISSCQWDHHALLTQLSKHDQKTPVPLLKFPAEPSCVCNMLVALNSNPYLQKDVIFCSFSFPARQRMPYKFTIELVYMQQSFYFCTSTKRNQFLVYLYSKMRPNNWQFKM